jgi:hypothetical protein
VVTGGFGWGLGGAGLGIGVVLDVLGGLDGVDAGLLVVGAGVVVAGALLLAPAATAPPPVVDPASDEPPEHAASANAPATATAPTKILFTIRHPHEVSRSTLSTRERRVTPAAGCDRKVTIR